MNETKVYTDVCDETDLELVFEDRMFEGEPVVEINVFNPSTEEGTGVWLNMANIEKLSADLITLIKRIKQGEVK